MVLFVAALQHLRKRGGRTGGKAQARTSDSLKAGIEGAALGLCVDEGFFAGSGATSPAPAPGKRGRGLPMVTVDVYGPADEPMSLFRAAADKLPGAHDKDGQLVTDGFLDVCQLVVPVIEQFGAAFSLVRNDINQNIERLRVRKASDPERFVRLFDIIDEEVSRDDHNHSKSCTKGLLWLKRALEFMMAIMRQLLAAPDMSMADVVYEQYHATLHRWHGWLASSAFNVAFNFVPSRDTFLEKVAGSQDPGAEAAMAQFIEMFSPVLAEVHTFLDGRGLDDPAKV